MIASNSPLSAGRTLAGRAQPNYQLLVLLGARRVKAHGITISMDGWGRDLGNIFVKCLWRSVKHEDMYLKDYATLSELVLSLTRYFAFYDTERIHQALGHRTPNAVYQVGAWGGVRIVDQLRAREKAGLAV